MNLNIKPSGSIFSTKDYSVFKTLDGNRIVNPLHVKKLVKSMQEKDLSIPIVVNEKFEVIDGQHRLSARTQLNLEVPFIICENYSLDDVHRANANHMKWSHLDFLKGYAEAGNSSYEFMLLTYEEHKNDLTVSNILRVTANIMESGGVHNKFKEGEWEVAIDARLQIVKLVNELAELSKIFGIKMIDAHFVDCYLKVSKMEEFDSTRFYERCSKYRHLMEKSMTISTYLFYFDKIYNYKSRDVVKLK